MFENSEKLIKKVLSENPETRGDDLELIFKVWEAQGVSIPDSIKHLLRHCYSPETIRRTRQRLNQLGLFKPSKQIQEQRNFLDYKYADELGRYF